MSGLIAGAKEDAPLRGILLMLGAYLMFSGIDTSAKWLGLAGLAAMQIAFMRYFGALVVAFAAIAKDGISRDRFATDRPWVVMLRGILLAASTVLNFIAITYLPLTLTSTILFSSPIIICALSWPLLGERVGPWRWAAIAIGFAGIAIAIRPFDAAFHPAVFLSLAGATCFAFYSILTRQLAGTISTNTMQFYSALVGSATLAPVAILQWQNPTNALDWALLLGIGLFGWAGHQALTTAHRFAPASTLSPYSYTFILYLGLWSFLLFGETPDAHTLLGAATIIAAGLVIWFRERAKGMRNDVLDAPPKASVVQEMAASGQVDASPVRQPRALQPKP